MPADHPMVNRIQNRRAVFILSFLIFLIYSNTFEASWHLDDYPNIVRNTRLQIDGFSFDVLSDSVRHPSNGNIWRPVAYLTFAVNRHFGHLNVFGYHLVNLLIHVLIACLLYSTVLWLYRSPALQNRCGNDVHLIALLAAGLWAANPIQTQAVTYIVQRMASLACLFYLLSLNLYIRGRLSRKRRLSYVYFGGCALSFILGLGSKENAIMLPAALLLTEALFFQDLRLKDVQKRLVRIGAVIALAIGFTGVLLFMQGRLPNLLVPQGGLDYSPLQRLLTQPRVLLFYISQIFYPVPTRLSIVHEFEISTSLFSPWSTLPAMFFIGGLIGFGLLQARKRPLLSFAILFFFLNHLIESTVLPLELVFEHRNYLPSLFAFVPVAAGVQQALDYYRRQKHPFYRLVAVFITLLMISLGTAAYIRNFAWATERSLWTDAHQKAPGSARPLNNLAWGYYEQIADYGTALTLYHKALTLRAQRNSHRAFSYNNIANIYYRFGDFKTAEGYWKKAIEELPDAAVYQYRMATVSFKQRQWETARLLLSKILEKHPQYFDALNLTGIVLLHEKKPLDALEAFKKCLELYPRQPRGLIHSGVTLSILQQYPKAEMLFKTALQRQPDDPMLLLRLIDINMKTGDEPEVERFQQKLFAGTTVHDIINKLIALAGEPYYDEGIYEELVQHLSKAIDHLSASIGLDDENSIRQRRGL